MCTAGSNKGRFWSKRQWNRRNRQTVLERITGLIQGWIRIWFSFLSNHIVEHNGTTKVKSNFLIVDSLYVKKNWIKFATRTEPNFAGINYFIHIKHHFKSLIGTITLPQHTLTTRIEFSVISPRAESTKKYMRFLTWDAYMLE